MDLAYEKAKEFGYDGRLYAPKIGAEFLDPKFWQALSKAFVWEEDGRKYGTLRWHYEAMKFMDYIMMGKDADTFFKELLSSHK